MCVSTAADISIASAASSSTVCVPNASMPAKQKISVITVTAPDSKKQISHNEKTRLRAPVALACFVSPVEPPSIKAIVEQKTVHTEELMLTDSFSDKVAYEKDIGKVMGKSRQSIQNISKQYFVKM